MGSNRTKSGEVSVFLPRWEPGELDAGDPRVPTHRPRHSRPYGLRGLRLMPVWKNAEIEGEKGKA